MQAFFLGLVNLSRCMSSKLFPGQLFFGKTAPMRPRATLEFSFAFLTPHSELSDKKRVFGTYLNPCN